MNRSQAGELISQTFTQSFDKDRFRNFAINLLNHIDENKAQAWSSQYVKDAFKTHVRRYERLGTYTSPGKEKIDVLVVWLTDNSKLERARTAIRNFVADHLKTRDEKDAALVAFVSPSESSWRFSYVKMDYESVKKDSGRISVERRLTPARRFSYIVGEGESCHTAQARFIELLQDTGTNPTQAQIEEAFSVEAVTKEFFTKYAELFEEIHQALEKLITKDKDLRAELTLNGVDTVDFAKKLMGQIVFLYFLQKKGWLGVEKGKAWGSGPHDFLRRLARGEYCKYDNFFNDVLEPLFFDTLATDRGHEAWCDRYRCRIPFLNGGLFEPVGGYDWRKTKILLPNRLFTNSERVDEGVTGSGVLDMFDRYNFTVNEAEPLEREVAIDPEMLGKVFENLIEENRRRGSGTYYTPREIVHYMCQESLVNFLDSALNSKEKTVVPRAEIETFIHLGDQYSFYETAKKSGTIGRDYPTPPESIEQNARLIDEKLAGISVCDPAVGSGAFPVGMMTEIVRARSALTPYFNDVHERTPYSFKHHAIQHSLYGVDIDPGAVEIAKLRLWLSLIVDEDDIHQIKPLPNLDYKIMQGNSLLEEYEGIPLFDEKLLAAAGKDPRASLTERIAEIQRLAIRLHASGELTKIKRQEFELETKRFTAALKNLNSSPKSAGPMLFSHMEQAAKKAEELRTLHARFFEESRHAEKERLKKQIGVLEWELIEATLREHGKESELGKLSQFRKLNARPFFLWKLNFFEVFQDQAGFDILIANPPYVSAWSMENERPGYRETIKARFHKYEVLKGHWDLYMAFILLGHSLLRNRGNLAFILPNPVLREKYASELRRFLLEQMTIDSLLVFDESNVFENVSRKAAVLVLLATPSDGQPIKMLGNSYWGTAESEIVSRGIISPDVWRRPPTYRFDANADATEDALLKKIEDRSVRVGNLCYVNYGAQVSSRESGKFKKKDVVTEKPKGNAKRFFEGRNLHRWTIEWPGLYLDYRKDEIYGPRTEELFACSPKIAIRHLSDGNHRIAASLDFDGLYCDHGVILVVPYPAVAGTSLAVNFEGYEHLADKVSLEYIAGSILSSVAQFYYRCKSATESLQQATSHIYPQAVRSLPIRLPDPKTHDLIVRHVKTLLKERKNQPQIEKAEAEIDSLLFKLYELDSDEITSIKKRIAAPDVSPASSTDSVRG